MKTLFIDFGNVIGFFDHQRAIRKLVEFTPLTAEELTKVLYGPLIEEPYEAGQLTTDQYVGAALELGLLSCSRAQFLEAFVDIFWPNREVCSLIPSLAEHYRIVLASNTNESHYQQYTQQFADVLKHFSALCPSHHLGWRKPHLTYFEKCQLQAEADPKDCLFLDDLAVNTKAAKVHGWQALLYRPGENLADQLRNLGLKWEPQ
jgi:glucose-1-phosphatase